MDIKDLIKEINILDIKPNQVLVIKMKGLINYEDIKEFQDHLSKFIGCKVFITGDNMELEVINVEDIK